jgi:hypothetical protein
MCLNQHGGASASFLELGLELTKHQNFSCFGQLVISVTSYHEINQKDPICRDKSITMALVFSIFFCFQNI